MFCESSFNDLHAGMNKKRQDIKLHLRSITKCPGHRRVWSSVQQTPENEHRKEMA